MRATVRLTPKVNSGLFWIASYPKSGNTWIRLFLMAAQGRKVDLAQMNGAPPIAVNRDLLESELDVGLADMSADEIADLRPLAYRRHTQAGAAPIFLKVHDSYVRAPSGDWMFPPGVTLGCLHLVRDPRDVCISYAAHNDISIDMAIDWMGERTPDPRHDYTEQTGESRGTWSSHAVSWLEAPIRRLTLRFEDLIDEPVRHFAEVAEFFGLGVSLLTVSKAVAATEFSVLARKEAETGFCERPERMPRFFRSGAVGQWTHVLTRAQVRRIERAHGATMRRLGYDLVTLDAETA
jgi:hypothetical protein